jgi:hypothetical protein
MDKDLPSLDYHPKKAYLCPTTGAVLSAPARTLFSKEYSPEFRQVVVVDLSDSKQVAASVLSAPLTSLAKLWFAQCGVCGFFKVWYAFGACHTFFVRSFAQNFTTTCPIKFANSNPMHNSGQSEQ